MGSNPQILRPIRKLQLADRPFHTAVSGDGRIFAACSESGNCRLFDSDLRQLDERNFGAGVQWVELDETGSILLVGFDDYIDGYATAGNLAPSFRLPVPGTSCSSCVFKPDEQVLCVASCPMDCEPKLEAWDLKSSTVIDEWTLFDGGGHFLFRHPEGEAMAVVGYTGDGEEWMYWAHYAHGRLRVFRQSFEGVASPCFHPTGRELVSYYERVGLCRMEFPSGQLLASVQPEEAFPDSPDDKFSYDIHFLRNDRFLAWQSGLALYEFDLETLRPTATVLTGVDGMTFGQDHFFSEGSWQLAGGRLLTSDNQMENRTDTLRLWDALALCGPISQPDPARPYTQALLAGL